MDGRGEQGKPIENFAWAFCMMGAIVQDYAARMAKMDGTTPEQIMDGLTKEANKRLEEFKKTSPVFVLPRTIPKLKSERAKYEVAFCKKLAIACDLSEVGYGLMIEPIAAKNKVIAEAMQQYFLAYKTYRKYYLELKQNNRGTLQEYYRLEKEMLAARKLVDGLVG